MNVQDISKLLPGLYTAKRVTSNAEGGDTPVTSNTDMVDRYEASPRIESELPGPDGPVSSATPEVLRRYVMEALVRQYSQGNAYFRLLYDPEELPELSRPSAASVASENNEAARTEEAKAENPEYERAVTLVGENGELSPRAVASGIGAAAQLMLNLNPVQLTGFQSAIQFAFTDFGKMFGGELPPITQQTLMTFTRDYNPFRTGIHVSEADDPIPEISESRAPDDNV